MELSLATLGASALTEGIKFLYSQAGEILTRWRERNEGRGSDAPVELPATPVIEGRFEPTTPNWGDMPRLEADIRAWRRCLVGYVDEGEPVNSKDEGLLLTVDALRRSLEVVLGQRITFKGEERMPSGPIIVVHSDVEEVAGYSASVCARTMSEGRVEVRRRTKVVGPGGQDVGVEVDRIGR